MNFSKIKIFFVACILIMMQACTNDFENINTNPNFPLVTEANPALLLPKIQYEVGNEMTASIAWGTGNIIAQLVSTNNFTGVDRYLLGTYEGTWNTLYRNMRDANNLYTLGESLGNDTYKAAALTLRAWMLAQLTEMYGDVPYSQALQGKSNEFQPAYDAQADIYTNILADLDEAATLASNSTSTADGDIMFNGDASKWAKLANSLRMRYLMRLENKWADLGINGASEMQAIVSSGIHFTSNADNGAVPYLDPTNRWPLNTARVGSFDEKRMSQRIEGVLKNLNDPRMQILFRPLDNPDSSSVYRGVPNGLSEDAASNYNGGANNQSRLGTRFREDPATVEMMIMNYSELMFIVAEAVQKGYISGTAATFYDVGVTANMDYYGITDATAVAAYLAQADVALTSNELEKIATQKWLSLFLVGNEAWYDFRRTGLPALTPGPNASLPQLPVRIQYPSSEQVLNTTNYNAVVASQGADENTTLMWLLK